MNMVCALLYFVRIHLVCVCVFVLYLCLFVLFGSVLTLACQKDVPNLGAWFLCWHPS